MSFILPVDELSLSEMRTFRKNAKLRAVKEAVRLSLATDEKGLVTKNIMPATDLGAPAGSGYTNEVFITGAVAANVWTSAYDTAAVPQLGNRKVLVIFKIMNMTAIPDITEVRFMLGTPGVTTLAVFHVEQIIDVKLTPECYMSEPVVYGPEQWVNIQCYARAAIPAAGERLAFGGYVVEPLGDTVS